MQKSIVVLLASLAEVTQDAAHVMKQRTVDQTQCILMTEQQAGQNAARVNLIVKFSVKKEENLVAFLLIVVYVNRHVKTVAKMKYLQDNYLNVVNVKIDAIMELILRVNGNHCLKDVNVVMILFHVQEAWLLEIYLTGVNVSVLINVDSEHLQNGKLMELVVNAVKKVIAKKILCLLLMQYTQIAVNAKL